MTTGALLAVDVAYTDADGAASTAREAARAAGVVFDAWSDANALDELVVDVDGIAPYEPGAFWKRELPCVRAAFDAARAKGHAIAAIIVDAYVDVGPGRAGLGRRVHEALGVAVVGVAKTRFHGAVAVEVLRGASASPLFVTAAGVDVDEAARSVRAMHGAHRVPTLLARADALARARVAPSS